MWSVSTASQTNRCGTYTLQICAEAFTSPLWTYIPFYTFICWHCTSIYLINASPVSLSSSYPLLVSAHSSTWSFVRSEHLRRLAGSVETEGGWQESSLQTTTTQVTNTAQHSTHVLVVHSSVPTSILAMLDCVSSLSPTTTTLRSTSPVLTAHESCTYFQHQLQLFCDIQSAAGQVSRIRARRQLSYPLRTKKSPRYVRTDKQCIPQGTCLIF